MSEETPFETELETDRATVAAYLRSLADGIEDGADLAFGDEAVRVPASTEFEVELERDGDEYELEIEVDCVPAGATAGDGPTDDTPTEDSASDADTADAGDERVPEAALESVDLGAPEAGGASSQATFEVYRDRADEWRWRLRHRNGEIIADSGEGYARRGTAENGLRSVKRNAPGAPVERAEE